MADSRLTNNSNSADPLLEVTPGVERMPLEEEIFRRMIAIERKRTERSKSPFLLMLLEAVGEGGAKSDRKTLERVATALIASSRDTDLVGWYKNNAIIAVMFTGLPVHDKRTVLDTFLSKVTTSLQEELTIEQFNQVTISFHLFPDDWDHDKPGRPSNATLYPDLTNHDKGRRGLLVVKRIIDMMGSAALLLLCAPLFMVIAAAIKLTSKGPVFFRQQRVGRYGKTFTFLKFRSMYMNNDANEHREYVRQLIAGQAERKSAEGKAEGIFKLTNDPRITPVGKVLRRSSLDELPQLFNVLRGEMSLVGPRPPLPYEVEVYATWHRRRLLEAKPGITGLWQVHGRSRVEFDDMVRLDLRYARECSPLLDLKILLQTPKAVMGGDGAC